MTAVTLGVGQRAVAQAAAHVERVEDISPDGFETQLYLSLHHQKAPEGNVTEVVRGVCTRSKQAFLARRNFHDQLPQFGPLFHLVRQANFSTGCSIGICSRQTSMAFAGAMHANSTQTHSPKATCKGHIPYSCDISFSPSPVLIPAPVHLSQAFQSHSFPRLIYIIYKHLSR